MTEYAENQDFAIHARHKDHYIETRNLINELEKYKLQSRPQEYLDTDRTIKLLLKNNAKTDIKDSNVKTQTQIAQECGYGDINVCYCARSSGT